MVDRRRMRKVPETLLAPRSGFAQGPHVVLCVDAAKHTPAYALGSHGVIQAVGFDSDPGRTVLYDNPDIGVLELSRSYGSRDAGKHGDIIAETCGGALTLGAQRAHQRVFVAPDEWAAQTKKPPRHANVWVFLTPTERKIVAAAVEWTTAQTVDHIMIACRALEMGKTPAYTHKVHNALDVAGLFLFSVGRVGRGVVPRA